MRKKIVAVGGGNFKKGATLPIDEQIVRLSGKKNPRLLFIPTASSDNPEYCTNINDYFTKLGCIVDTLLLVREKPDQDQIAHKIGTADIIYVGGGNTLKMMRIWRNCGIPDLLDKARTQGVVLCGVSAGSICWFTSGNSDSRKDKNPAADYIKVAALGFIDALHCPHYDSESDRQESLKKMMRRSGTIAVALEDCAALEIVDSTYRILSSRPGAQGYKIYWHRGIYYKEPLEPKEEYTSLDLLLAKGV
jgi:dipeptidase E